ncbi:MAG: 3-deoxy-8-phosphooctulonate synthase [Candidatus Ratteibacteria bacterium]|jgi:2-dehydro-3-deoxyphosphooctonate aldolase (KDO 8-P synthase)
MIVEIDKIRIGEKNPFCLIAGPCVVENEKITLAIAEKLKKICERLSIPLIFKASYDKANRTSVCSFRGPGLKKGLQVLARVKAETGLPVLSDIHQPSEAKPASEVLDVIQVPAFLCRQTDLLLAAGRTNRVVNVKKGQFVAPEDTARFVDKIKSTGNSRVLLTERGTFFGYHNLVVDFCGFQVMSAFAPIIFDATHSVQQPALGEVSGGRREFVPLLIRGALAAGCAGLFLEVHPKPEEALSDGPNMIRLDNLTPLLEQAKEIDTIIKK